MKRNNGFNILKKYFLFFCIGCVFSSKSQQIPLYSQYYLNSFIYNPAYTGSEKYSNVFLIHRDQWTSFPDNPSSNFLSFDAPIKSKKIGLGLSFQNEVRGLNTKSGGYGSYSYKLNLADSGALLFGLSLGLLSDRIDFSKAIVKDPNDPSFSNEVQKNIVFDSKAGVALVFKKMEFGLSALQLAGGALQQSNYNLVNHNSRHFLISYKYTFLLNSEKKIKFSPMFLGRLNSGSPMQYDINGVFDWQQKGWAAITYRSNYAVGLNFGVRLYKNLSIGYAYDIIFNSLGTGGGLSHEILLGYRFSASGVNKYNREIRKISKKLKKEGESVLQLINNGYETKEKNSTQEEMKNIDNQIENYNKDLKRLQELIDKKKELKD